jgi:hypothetical protein
MHEPPRRNEKVARRVTLRRKYGGAAMLFCEALKL